MNEFNSRLGGVEEKNIKQEGRSAVFAKWSLERKQKVENTQQILDIEQ